MQARSYRLAPAAVEDIEDIVDYLRVRNPVAAVRFLESAQATFEHLALVPAAYPALDWDHAELEGVRHRALTGAFRLYVAYYRSHGQHVDILRVLHSARDTESLLGLD